MRARIDQELARRRQETGANIEISAWIREAAAEKLVRDCGVTATEIEAFLTFPLNPPTP
jgi:hypothetical protein